MAETIVTSPQPYVYASDHGHHDDHSSAFLALANQDSINTQGIIATTMASERATQATAERFGISSVATMERFGLAELEAIRDTKESVTTNAKDIIIDACNKHTVNLLQHSQTQREVEEKTCEIKALILESAAKTQDMIRDDREQRLRDDLAAARQELLLVRLGGTTTTP